MYSHLYKYGRLISQDGRDLNQKVNELMHSQWLSREALEELQLGKIRRLLEHVYNYVPGYKQRFQALGLHPHDIKTLVDFQQVPITTKQDIQQNPTAYVATNFAKESLFSGLTGGSTGDPLVYYRDPEALNWNWAVLQRNRTWFGFSEGMKQAWFWGRDEDIPLSQSDKLKTWLRRQKWLTCYNMGEDQMRAFANTLRHFQPDFIFGYTSAIHLFAQYLQKNNIVDIRPKAIQTAAEKLHDFQRELITEVFKCPVIDHYAAMELGPLAAECLESNLHIAAETKYVEIILNDRPAKAGEVGEILVTDLHNFAMPFIRYKGGDLAALAGSQCGCGRGLPVIQEITGRKTDFFTMPSGKLVFGLYWGKRMREVPGVKRFRVHQSKIDTIEITYEADNGFNEGLLQAKKQEILKTLNEPLHISFTRVEQIPLSRVGKHLFISTDVPVNLDREKLEL